MLEAPRAGDEGKTIIFGYPHALNFLSAVKDSSLRMGPGDKNYSRSISTWDGFAMIGSYNFKKRTEDFVDISGDNQVEIGEDLKVFN